VPWERLGDARFLASECSGNSDSSSSDSRSIGIAQRLRENSTKSKGDAGHVVRITTESRRSRARTCRSRAVRKRCDIDPDLMGRLVGGRAV